MAKICWICEKKLNMLNIISFDNKSICADCRDLFDKITFSQNQEDIEHYKNSFLETCAPESEAAQYITKYAQQRLTKIECDAEQEQLQKKEQEQLQKKEQEIAMLIKEKEERKHREEQEALEKARVAAQEKNDIFLKSNGYEGYYEYKAVSVYDVNDGSLNINYLNEMMNKLGREGWHLRCAFANELGHNSNSGGIMGISIGTNSTIDQNVFIFERFIKFNN